MVQWVTSNNPACQGRCNGSTRVNGVGIGFCAMVSVTAFAMSGAEFAKDSGGCLLPVGSAKPPSGPEPHRMSLGCKKRKPRKTGLSLVAGVGLGSETAAFPATKRTRRTSWNRQSWPQERSNSDELGNRPCSRRNVVDNCTLSFPEN